MGCYNQGLPRYTTCWGKSQLIHYKTLQWLQNANIFFSQQIFNSLTSLFVKLMACLFLTFFNIRAHLFKYYYNIHRTYIFIHVYLKRFSRLFWAITK